MNAIEQLKQDYERRLDTVNEILGTTTFNGSLASVKKEVRLNTKASEYRTIISELSRILPEQSKRLTEERIKEIALEKYPPREFWIGAGSTARKHDDNAHNRMKFEEGLRDSMNY